MSNLMPPGWTAHQTPDGRWYYANAHSGVTQWTPPPPQGAPHYPNPPHHGQPHNSHSHPQHAYDRSHHSHAKPSGSHSSSRHRYVYNHPVEFKLKEKYWSLSGDSFSIKNTSTGEATFKVKGKAMSLRDSKALYDLNGNDIYKMTESIISLRGRMQITDSATKQPVLTLRKKGFIPMMGTSTIQGWKGPSDDGEPDIVCKGDFLRKDYTIKDGSGRVIATVKRKSFNISNILLDKDTYVIRIEPGQDAALLVFFVIAVDEQYRDDGNRRGYGSLLDF